MVNPIGYHLNRIRSVIGLTYWNDSILLFIDDMSDRNKFFSYFIDQFINQPYATVDKTSRPVEVDLCRSV